MKPETVESLIKYAKIGVGVVALFASGAYTGHVATKSAEVPSTNTASACPPPVVCRDVKVSCIAQVQKADPIKVEFVPSKVIK
jgi:hypothetical protein